MSGHKKWKDIPRKAAARAEEPPPGDPPLDAATIVAVQAAHRSLSAVAFAYWLNSINVAVLRASSATAALQERVDTVVRSLHSALLESDVSPSFERLATRIINTLEGRDGPEA